MNSGVSTMCQALCFIPLSLLFILMSVLKRVLISQIRKLKARGLYLVQGHIASQWQSTDISPICLTHKAHASHPPFCLDALIYVSSEGLCGESTGLFFFVSLHSHASHTSLTVGDMHCSMVKSTRSTGLTCKPSEC